MKAVLYARVSSKEQAETGYSLPAQEKLLKEYALKRGFKIAKIFSVSESASGKSQRAVFNEMLNFVRKNNIKVIICEKVDRLTRNLRDAVKINEWMNEDPEREIHFVKEACILTKDSKSHEKFIWNIKVSVAQFYTDNLSEEVKKGQMEKLREGWLPTKPPLGYKTIGEKGHKIHVLDEKVAPLIRKMFEIYATGNVSLKKLVEIMYAEGLRTRRGGKLVKSRIAELLSNPFYYGKIRWKGKLYDGKHKPLISKELFDRVQSILKAKRAPKYRKHFYLFKGLIRCAECKGLITWEEHKGIVYGHCNHYRNCTQKRWVKEKEVETQILEALGNFEIKSRRLVEWIRKALKEGHQDEIEYHKSALEELKRSYERIQRRIDQLYDDKVDGRIDEEFFNHKFEQYKKEKEKIINAIQRHSNASNKYFELSVNLYELSQRAREIYQKASLEEKRDLISLVFEELLLDEGKLIFTYSKPFQLLYEAINSTNSSKVLSLAESSPEIFELSESLDNKGKLKSFHPEFCKMLQKWDDFRTRWEDVIDCYELAVKQVKELLNLV